MGVELLSLPASSERLATPASVQADVRCLKTAVPLAYSLSLAKFFGVFAYQFPCTSFLVVS